MASVIKVFIEGDSYKKRSADREEVTLPSLSVEKIDALYEPVFMIRTSDETDLILSLSQIRCLRGGVVTMGYAV